MAPTVDVRDMSCAQALAQAARALKPLVVGQALDIVCNAPDVKDDLSIWARELGHAVPTTQSRGGEFVVTVRKGT
ncbi:MAG: sulfurtransferase TusA family protein [Candidatus Omnitrophica bacterium]|nr:sulfurtransferase TusA family protein [Candidatus Omnitrophota bacterium]